MKTAKQKTLFITYASVIAAMYTVLTMLAFAFGLSGGAIQVRFSESLCILAYFTPAAIPGLFAGCLISNILSGAMVLDVILGSLATLIGAIFTYLLRKLHPILAPIPPIIANTAIIPPILKYVYGLTEGTAYLYLTVFAGEVISCGVLGLVLLYALKKRSSVLFPKI